MAALEERGVRYGSGVAWGERWLTFEARGGCEVACDNPTITRMYGYGN